MRVLKYYAENKALFETWQKGEAKLSIIILWGIKIFVKQLKSCFSLCQKLQTYCNFKLDSQKVDQLIGGKWLIHGTKHHKDNQLQPGTSL